MKVKELIEKLQKENPESIVVANVWEDEEEIVTVETYTNEEDRPYCKGDNMTYAYEIPIGNIVYLIGRS